jgi:hypothetical protein
MLAALRVCLSCFQLRPLLTVNGPRVVNLLLQTPANMTRALHFCILYCLVGAASATDGGAAQGTGAVDAERPLHRRTRRQSGIFNLNLPNVPMNLSIPVLPIGSLYYTGRLCTRTMTVSMTGSAGTCPSGMSVNYLNGAPQTCSPNSGFNGGCTQSGSTCQLSLSGSGVYYCCVSQSSAGVSVCMNHKTTFSQRLSVGRKCKLHQWRRANLQSVYRLHGRRLHVCVELQQ